MTNTIYGIKNCDTMKKAFVFLKHKGVDYVFHDYKVSGISESLLNQWCDVLGFDNVLNKAGTTFKKLDEADRTNVDRTKAISLMLAQPSMIKRPVLNRDGVLTLGFKPEIYETLF